MVLQVSPTTICSVRECSREADPDFCRTPVCAHHGTEIAEAFLAVELPHGVGRQVRTRREATNRGGWVYYLRLGDRIKIGHTGNLRQRLAAYPPDAVLLAAHPGSRADEAALHQLFQSYCIVGREWYGGHHAPILDHVEAMRQKHGSPDDLAVTPKRIRRRNAQPAHI